MNGRSGSNYAIILQQIVCVCFLDSIPIIDGVCKRETERGGGKIETVRERERDSVRL